MICESWCQQYLDCKRYWTYTREIFLSVYSCTLMQSSASKVVGCTQQSQEITEEVTRYVKVWHSGWRWFMHNSNIVCFTICLANLWSVFWILFSSFRVGLWYFNTYLTWETKANCGCVLEPLVLQEIVLCFLPTPVVAAKLRNRTVLKCKRCCLLAVRA